LSFLRHTIDAGKNDRDTINISNPSSFIPTKKVVGYFHMWILIVKMEDSKSKTIYAFRKLLHDVSDISMW